MTLVPCFLSIALIAWARRDAYHRPISKGWSAISATRMKNIDERSNDIGSYAFTLGLDREPRSHWPTQPTGNHGYSGRKGLLHVLDPHRSPKTLRRSWASEGVGICPSYCSGNRFDDFRASSESR